MYIWPCWLFLENLQPLHCAFRPAQPNLAPASAGDSLFRSGRRLAGDGDFDVVAPAWHATGRFTVSPKEQTSCTGCSEALHDMI